MILIVFVTNCKIFKNIRSHYLTVVCNKTWTVRLTSYNRSSDRPSRWHVSLADSTR